MNRATRYITPGWRSSFPHRCLGCGMRKALFRFNGRVYAKRDHTLCPRCFGSLVDSIHAKMGRRGETPFLLGR